MITGPPVLCTSAEERLVVHDDPGRGCASLDEGGLISIVHGLELVPKDSHWLGKLSVKVDLCVCGVLGGGGGRGGAHVACWGRPWR